MPRERPQIVEKEYMDQAMVQISFRLPLRLRIKLDAYLQYMDRPLSKRSEASREWPETLQATIGRSLEDFLASHRLVERTSEQQPVPAKRTPIKARKRQPEGETIGRETEGV